MKMQIHLGNAQTVTPQMIATDAEPDLASWRRAELGVPPASARKHRAAI